MKKKILIVGNSAGAYALAKKLSEQHEIFVAPAADSFTDFAQGVDIRETSINELLEFVFENGIDMTVAISEAAIEADIAKIFNQNKQSVFAPAKKAAMYAIDKCLAKKTLYKLRIPTPKFGIFEKQNMLNDYIKNQKIPFVMKTNEKNSAVVLTSASTAKNLTEAASADKNKRIIIEDYIYGTPFSFYAITDGYKALPFGSAITYKHSLEGDGGQLTGGMGACAPNYKLSTENEYFLMDNVIYPVLDYMEIEGNPYLGILGVNGILTDDGKLSVLGWNSFLQDCDAAAVLNNIDDDLYELFDSCIIGSFSDEVSMVKTKDAYSVTLVLNCTNRENKENIINGLDSLNENTVVTLYPSVKKNRYLEYEANYGNVLSVTAAASSSAKAGDLAYDEVSDISFSGLNYRKDICRVTD